MLSYGTPLVLQSLPSVPAVPLGPAASNDLVTSVESDERIRREKIRTSTPEVRALIAATKEDINIVERNVLLVSEICPVEKLSSFQKKLSNIEPEHLKYLLRENYYNADFMKTVLCATSAIFYSDPITAKSSLIGTNQRVRRWIKSIDKIGEPSVEGIAFRGSFDIASDVFVIKTPKTPYINLRHELVIGLKLNQLRRQVPNFAYVFGGFMCTQPVLSTDESRKEPVGWCNLDDPAVQYIVYENINPSVSMEEYCKTCTFTQFLEKYLQVLFAESVAWNTFDYTHYDLHFKNVLVRDSKLVYIPYVLDGETIYVKTTGVATIIDYGFSHIKLTEGTVGVSDVNLVVHGIFPTISFPMYDAFKLLMFSASSALSSGNTQCFSRMKSLIAFFNTSEPAEAFVENMYKELFSLPYSSKTAGLTFYDLIRYIKINIPEYNSVVTSRLTRSANILGCMGNNLCMSTEESISDLGLNADLSVHTIFDFYDVVSKLESEGNLSAIDRVISTFPATDAYGDAVAHMNELINELNRKQANLDFVMVGDTPESLNNPTYAKLYKTYLTKLFEIYDLHQQLNVINIALEFFTRYYDIDVTDLNRTIETLSEYLREFQQLIYYVKYDNERLSAVLDPTFKALNYPELDILSRV